MVLNKEPSDLQDLAGATTVSKVPTAAVDRLFATVRYNVKNPEHFA